MFSLKKLLTIFFLIVLTAALFAQSGAKPAVQDPNGFTSSIEFGGTSNITGQIYELTTSAGYDFNLHFGVDLGIPFYFIRPSSSSGGSSTNGLGNPFVDLRLHFSNQKTSFGSVLTGFAPVGDSKKGLSTGRGTFDWSNHLDHAFGQLKPFVEAGAANTIPSSRMFVRPYTTLGFNTHFQAGATYDLWKFLSVGASGYDIVPSGQQTVFSRVAHGGVPSHGRVFEGNQQTTGGADIAKDNGFSAWVDASPRRGIDLELGFNRSMQYDLNSISFTLGFNLKQLYGRQIQK